MGGPIRVLAVPLLTHRWFTLVCHLIAKQAAGWALPKQAQSIHVKRAYECSIPSIIIRKKGVRAVELLCNRNLLPLLTNLFQKQHISMCLFLVGVAVICYYCFENVACSS